MNLKEHCEAGSIGIRDFCELLGSRPRRTHLLNAGDYVVLTPIFEMGEGSKLELEEIAELDSPEPGDFTTVKGTIAPISGNVYVKTQESETPRNLLIEGDRIGKPTCPSPVYDLVNRYLAKRVPSNS